MANGRYQGGRAEQNIIEHFANVNLDDLKKEDIVSAAKKFSEELSGKNFKINQLRKFYNEIMALKNRYNTKKLSDDQLKLDLAIFLSKIEYGKNKAKSGEKDSFAFYLKNIETLVNKTNNYNNFKNFVTIMEAIVAYFPKQN